MTTSSSQLREGCVVIGSLFNEPMRVETVRVGGLPACGETQAGGTWVAVKIFTKRIPHTVDFQMDGP